MVMTFVDGLLFLWSVLLLMRYFLQKGGLNYSHPVARFLYIISQWIVGPLRKGMPPVLGWDIAILLAVFLVLFCFEAMKLLYLISYVQAFLNGWISFLGVVVLPLLKTFSAWVYAFWIFTIVDGFQLRDRKLGAAIRAAVVAILGTNPRYRHSKLGAIFLGAIWIWLLYPELLYILQSRAFWWD
jgi:hypothetical protein